MSEETVKPKQLKAISLMLEGTSIKRIIEELKIDRNTLWRWKKETIFISEYNKQGNAISNGLKYKHQKLVEESFKVLEETLKTGTDKQKITVAMAIIKAYKPLPEEEESQRMIEDHMFLR
jgi:transposase